MTQKGGDRILKISYEDAVEEATRLKDAIRTESGGVEVYTGEHPEYGVIHIIIPSASDGLMLLPLVSLSF